MMQSYATARGVSLATGEVEDSYQVRKWEAPRSICDIYSDEYQGQDDVDELRLLLQLLGWTAY